MGFEPTESRLSKEEELGKGLSGSGNSKCKGPEVASRNNKEASVGK